MIFFAKNGHKNFLSQKALLVAVCHIKKKRRPVLEGFFDDFSLTMGIPAGGF